GVDISQAEDFCLIEQQRLQAALRTRQSVLQILKTEFIREGLGRKFANSFCAGDTRIRNQLDDSELSLIAEHQTTIVVEAEDGMSVSRQRFFRVEISEFARHPQMHDQDIPGAWANSSRPTTREHLRFVEIDQDEFAATAHAD